MTSEYNLALNFNNNIPVKTDLTFKQGDKGITLNLATSGLDTTGTTAHIVFKRGNGTSVEAELTGQSGPTYSYTILGNEFEVPGVVVADLKLYNGDAQRVSTASFIFLVTGDTMDGVGGGTGGYSDQLEQLSQEFEDTLEEYKDAFGDVGAVNPRGAYDSTADYNVLDLVSYQCSSYLCRTACKNKVPTNTTYWQVFAAGGASPDAEDVNYDNTTSQLTADNVQDALDELAARPSGGGAAEDVSYDNSDSRLAAENVQDAVDETNDRITYLYSMTGGKNLNVYPYSDKTKTSSGVTWTDRGDGTIHATGGTGSTYSRFELHSSSARMFLPNGTYIYSGCPNGGGDSTYSMFLSYTKGGSTIGVICTGTEVQFTIDGSDGDATGASVRMGLDVESNVTLPTGGITFKPMIRDASIVDDTYVSYAKTNRELTQEQAKNTDLTSIIATGSTNTTGAKIPLGAYFYLNDVFCRAIADIAIDATFTKNTNYIETTAGGDLDDLLFKGTDGQGEVITSSGGSYTTPFNGFISGTITSSSSSSNQASVRINGVTFARAFASAVFICFPCPKGSVISTTGTGTFSLWYSK